MNKHPSNHTRKTQSINLSVFQANSVQALVAWRPLTLMEAFQHLLRFLGPSQLGWKFDRIWWWRWREAWRKLEDFFGRIIISKKDHIDTLKISKDFIWNSVRKTHNEFGFHDGEFWVVSNIPFLGQKGATNWLSSWRTTPRSNDDFWSAAFAKEVMTWLNGWSLKRNLA